MVKTKELLDLANHVEKLPPKRFNFNFWVGKDWQGHPDLSCGTTACILGWAAVLMPELGMKIAQFEYGLPAAILLKEEEPTRNMLCYSQSLGTACTVFGLDEEQSNFLFTPNVRMGGMVSPDEEATPQEAADHIRRFVQYLEEESVT